MINVTHENSGNVIKDNLEAQCTIADNEELSTMMDAPHTDDSPDAPTAEVTSKGTKIIFRPEMSPLGKCSLIL